MVNCGSGGDDVQRVEAGHPGAAMVCQHGRETGKVEFPEASVARKRSGEEGNCDIAKKIT